MYRLLKVIFLVVVFFAGGCGTTPGKTYLVGIDPLWYPIDLMGREKTVEGFANELLQEISKLQNIKLVTVQKNWNDILESLQEKKVAGILSSMPPYSFYEKIYDFSDVFLSTGPVLVVPSDSNIDSLDKMEGKEIAVLRDSTAVLIVEKNASLLIRIYDSVPQALNDILAGVVDCAVIDVLVAEGYVQDLYQGKLKIATAPLNGEGLRLVMLHDREKELLQAFNAGLRELQKNGKYHDLTKKWSLSE